MNSEIKTKGSDVEQDLMLSDDEIDLIWLLPYLPERDRVQEIVKAQLDKALEFFTRPARDITAGCLDYVSQPDST